MRHDHDIFFEILHVWNVINSKLSVLAFISIDNIIKNIMLAIFVIVCGYTWHLNGTMITFISTLIIRDLSL